MEEWSQEEMEEATLILRELNVKLLAHRKFIEDQVKSVDRQLRITIIGAGCALLFFIFMVAFEILK